MRPMLRTKSKQESYTINANSFLYLNNIVAACCELTSKKRELEIHVQQSISKKSPTSKKNGQPF